jgi:hypothetical protein
MSMEWWTICWKTCGVIVKASSRKRWRGFRAATHKTTLGPSFPRARRKVSPLTIQKTRLNFDRSTQRRRSRQRNGTSRLRVRPPPAAVRRPPTANRHPGVCVQNRTELRINADRAQLPDWRERRMSTQVRIGTVPCPLGMATSRARIVSTAAQMPSETTAT